MTTFTHRAEEDALGALIYAPHRIADVPHLDADHFADIDHRVIFTALKGALADEPHLHGEALVNRLAYADRSPAITSERLVGLAFAYADPIDLTEAGDQVIAHAVRRELAVTRERLQRLTEPLAPGPWFPDYDALLERMRHLEANTGIDWDPGWPSQPNGHAPEVRNQEIVLAGLIQNPELVQEISDWIPIEAFTAANRRDIYQAVLAVDDLAAPPAGGFGDLLVRDAREARTSYLSTGTADTDLDRYSPVERSSYIAHLGRSTTDPHLSAEAAQTLLENLARAETSHTSAISAALNIGLQPARSRPLAVEHRAALSTDPAAHLHRPALTQSREISLDPPF